MRRPRSETAELIWNLLRDHPEGMSRMEIREALDLSEMQFHYGLGLIRDALQERFGQPIAYDPMTYRYTLPPVWEEDQVWVDWRLGSIRTQIARVEKNVNAASERYADVPGLRRIRRDLSRLTEDLAEILLSLEPAPQTNGGPRAPVS